MGRLKFFTILILLHSLVLCADNQSIIDEARSKANEDYPPFKLVVASCLTFGLTSFLLWKIDERPIPSEHLLGKTSEEIALFTLTYKNQRKNNFMVGSWIGPLFFGLYMGTSVLIQFETGACAI